jgi:hypothetical protein
MTTLWYIYSRLLSARQVRTADPFAASLSASVVAAASQWLEANE